MDKKRLHKSVLAGILALVLVLGLAAGFLPTSADAASSSELKQQLNALKQQKSNLEAEIRNLRNQISENSSEIENMVAEKNVIDQEIFLLYQQIDNINNQIATYSMLIADKQEELVAAEANYAELLEDNKERIQAMEEEGEVTYWSVLFQANNFADLLDRLNMVQEIAAADKRRLDALNEAAKVVADAKAVLEEEKVGLEETKQTLDDTQQELEAKREEADELLVELVNRGMEYEALVAMSESAKEQPLLDIAKKEDGDDDSSYREWLATSIPPTTNRKGHSETEATMATTPTTDTEPGDTTTATEPEETKATEATVPETTAPATVTWRVPISYTAVTSRFGPRTAPTAGASTYHYGVDLAAPKGRPIYATRSGTVSIATYDSSCGYYVQINHGDGYKSIYMHMTNYVVSKGQTVSQGQVIGYCGSTGISTGYHLHFGISKNGSYVNPANYISICFSSHSPITGLWDTVLYTRYLP